MKGIGIVVLKAWQEAKKTEFNFQNNFQQVVHVAHCVVEAADTEDGSLTINKF